MVSNLVVEFHGGRFASPGTPAVYLSESDAAATNEVTGRKKRLGGGKFCEAVKRYAPSFGFSLNGRNQNVVEAHWLSIHCRISKLSDFLFRMYDA